MLENKLYDILKKISEIDNIENLEIYSKQILQTDIRVIGKDEQRFVSNLKTYIKNFLCKALMQREREICKTINSKLHLTKLFSKRLYNGIEQDKLPLRGHTRTIGSIPKVFFKKINNPQKTALKIFNLFAEYSMKLNYDFGFKLKTFDKEKEFLEQYFIEFEHKLSQLINQEVKIEYIGSGANGNGFKLTIGSQIFCYKTFFIYNSADIPNTCCHGTIAETQMSLFATKNSRKDKFAKFFFGKIGHKYNIDSFMVTEFVDKTKVNPLKKHYYIDHISSMDSNPKNRISGKMVDFGALKIEIPELTDKKLRKLVRVICNSIIYNFDTHKISYQWYFPYNNLLQLHNYLSNIDEKLYKKAFNLILSYSNGISIEMQEFLLDLKNTTPKKSMYFEETLQSNHIFVTDTEVFRKNANLFNIYKTETPPMEIFNSLGHIIINLYDNFQCVVFYREQIEKIRIEKLQEDNSFKTILEKSKEEINNIDNIEIYKLK